MKTKYMLVALLVIMTTALFAGAVSAQDGDGPRDRDRDHDRRHPVAQVVNTIAEELGIDFRDVAQELRDGATLAEVIEANGSSVDEITELLLAEAETRLSDAVAEGRITQEQMDERLAQMTERLPELLENGFQGINPPERETPRMDGAREFMSTIAGELDVEPREIFNQLRDGATLAEVIEANGGNVDEITTTLLTNIEMHLNEQVAEGNITQTRADQRLERATTFIANLMNGEFPPRPNDF